MRSDSSAIVFVEASSTGAGEVTAKYAKEIGLITILIAQTPNNYGSQILQYMDHVVTCTTEHLERLLEQVKSLDFKVEGVTTTNDLFVPHASYVASKMDLPSMNYDDVMKARNKYNMRLALEVADSSLNPSFEIAHSYNEAVKICQKLSFPVIFKPQDLNDSLHVNLIKNDEDVRRYFDSITEWNDISEDGVLGKAILIEEYIQGEEYSLETYQFHGEEIQLIGIFKKIMTGIEHDSFVELGVTFPHDDLNDFVFPKISAALQKLGINCGVIHTEFRIMDGEIKILEINPRLIGDMAGSHLLNYSLGDNPAHFVVDIAIDNKKILKPTYRRSCTLMGICLPQTGYFHGIENEEALLDAGALMLGAIKPLGDMYNVPPQSNIDVVARIITEDQTIEKSIHKANEVVSFVKFKSEN